MAPGTDRHAPLDVCGRSLAASTSRLFSWQDARTLDGDVHRIGCRAAVLMLQRGDGVENLWGAALRRIIDEVPPSRSGEYPIRGYDEAGTHHDTHTAVRESSGERATRQPTPCVSCQPASNPFWNACHASPTTGPQCWRLSHCWNAWSAARRMAVGLTRLPYPGGRPPARSRPTS